MTSLDEPTQAAQGPDKKVPAKISEAIPAFHEAFRLKLNYVKARHNLGQAYLLQKQAAEAANDFAEILRTQADFESGQRGVARARKLQSS